MKRLTVFRLYWLYRYCRRLRSPKKPIGRYGRLLAGRNVRLAETQAMKI